MIESGDGHSRDSNQEIRPRGPTDGVHLSKTSLSGRGSKKDFPLVPSMRKMRWNGASSYSDEGWLRSRPPLRAVHQGKSVFCHATGSVRACAITTELSLTDMVRNRRCQHVFDRKLYR